MTLTAADCLLSTATEWGSSRWAAHNRCGAEYDLRYNKRVYRLPMARESSPQTKPIAFHVGTIVHAGIRLVETASMAAAEAISAIADAAVAQGSRFTSYDVYEGQRLLEAYWAFWGEENFGWPEGLRVVATELQLRASGLQHTGAIDTLLQDDSGNYFIVDTKTRAQKLPDDCERAFATNPQFLSLSYMAQEKFDLDNPPPVIVNAIVKTKIPGFERPLVKFRQKTVDEWAKNQAAIELRDEVLYRSNEELEPVKNYSACAPAIGSKCDYFYYCHAESEEERELKYGVGLKQEPEEEAA